MSLAFSTGARAVAAGGASRRSAAAAAATVPRRGRGRSFSFSPRADLHGLVAMSPTLFPPAPSLSGASTPSQRPASSLSNVAADPSKREAFARVLKASLLGLTAALAGGAAAGGGGSGQRQRQQTPQQQQQQRSASPPLQLPPEVLEAEEDAAESSGGWGRSHIAERLATMRVSKLPPLGGDDGH